MAFSIETTTGASFPIWGKLKDNILFVFQRHKYSLNLQPVRNPKALLVKCKQYNNSIFFLFSGGFS